MFFDHQRVRMITCPGDALVIDNIQFYSYIYIYTILYVDLLMYIKWVANNLRTGTCSQVAMWNPP